MPQIQGDPDDTEKNPAGRIRGAHQLLTTSALIMSVFLILSSFVTTLLIPPAAFEDGGQANGRALAYLAHEHLGTAFGTAYDLSTIAILWFAGASAMAGLLNLVPRYLPRYGMAPRWARAIRPLVLVFTGIGFFVTWYFKADVNAQGGAYATGVLVLITSASIAVTLTAHRRHHHPATLFFATVAAIFTYTTVANMFERPDGLRIGALFILAILVVSFLSRAGRAFQLRGAGITFDPAAEEYITAAAKCGTLYLIPNEPDARDSTECRDKTREIRAENNLPKWAPLIFIEITVTDASDFETQLSIIGEERFGHRILTIRSSVVANTIAETALAIRNRTGLVPHIYFTWTEGNPITNLLRFLFIGDGEIAPVTREVLREAEPDPEQRPESTSADRRGRAVDSGAAQTSALPDRSERRHRTPVPAPETLRCGQSDQVPPPLAVTGSYHRSEQVGQHPSTGLRCPHAQHDSGLPQRHGELEEEKALLLSDGAGGRPPTRAPDPREKTPADGPRSTCGQ